jgi:hypothetical protein
MKLVASALRGRLICFFVTSMVSLLPVMMMIKSVRLGFDVSHWETEIMGWIFALTSPVTAWSYCIREHLLSTPPSSSVSKDSREEEDYAGSEEARMRNFGGN